MPGEPLIEELSLDIQPALDALEPLGNALTALATDFATSIADALASLSSLQAAPVDVAVTADTSALDVGIADALDAPRPPVDVEGDATPLSDAIDAATSVSPTVTVAADTSEAETAISGLDTAPVDVVVTADTSEAQDAIDSLSSAATDAVGSGGGGSGGGGGGGGGSGLSGLEGAVLGVKAASAGATGDVGGLTGEIGGLSAGLGSAIAGGVAFTAFLGETVNLAADAQAQQARFNATFGNFADQARQINVGGLVTDLATLGKQSGTTVSDLENSATRIGLLGNAAGAAGPEVAKTASDLLGLAGAIAVSNPRFGDAATVADTLSRALSTGRTRSLIPYGISLSQNAIQEEALRENAGKTKDELTGFDKVVAGLTLVLQQQGDTLGTKFAAGVQNAGIQLRALKTDLEETLIAVGGPLLEPVVQSLTAVLPIAQEVGVVLGDLGQIIIPLVGAAAPLLVPLAGVLRLVGDGLQGVKTLLAPLDSGLGTVIIGIGALTAVAYAVVPALEAMFVAGSLSMGPAGWIALGVAALAALGGALDLFGGHAKEATIDSTSLDSAFTGVTGSASAFTDVLGGVNKAVDDYLQKNLAIKIGGQSGVDVVNNLGTSFSGVSAALTGTDAQFEGFLSNITTTEANVGSTDKAFGKFHDTLVEGRQTLEDNAQQTIAAAQASGLLTKAQVDAGIATFKNKGFNDDYGHVIVDNISLLRELAPQLAIATHQTDLSTFATFKASDSYNALQNAIKQGALSLSDAKNVATEYGITQDQATQIITDAEQAQDKLATKTLLTNAAYGQLVAGIAAGTVSTPDAIAQFQAMGFSLDGATQKAKDVASAISSMVSSIDGALPSVGGAIDAFQKKIEEDFKKVVDDTQKGTGNVKADLASLANDSDPARFSENLLKQTANIQQFTSNLQRLVNEGFAGLAASLAAKGPEVAGSLAAGLASDPSKARVAASVELLNQAAIDKYNKLAPALQVGSEQATAAAAAGLTDASGVAAGGQKQGAAAASGFAQTADLSTPAGQALAAANTTFATFTGLNATAMALGADTGTLFGEGVAIGILSQQSAVQLASITLGISAEASLKQQWGIKSPSTVGAALGGQFSSGVALGVTSGTGVVVGAGAGLSAALVTQLQQTLTAGLAQATAQGAVQNAVGQVVSTATSALPTVGSDITAFGQTLAQAVSAQATALKEYHKAFGAYSDDLAKQRALQAEAAQSLITLQAASARFNELQLTEPKKATNAQKLALQEARSAYDSALSNFKSLGTQLDSISAKITTQQKAVGDASKTLSGAQKDLAAASDASTFVKNINAQTAAGERFLSEVRTLKNAGFVDLAKQLAEAGPDAAGRLASAFASSPAKAKSAEAAIDHANAFAAAYQAQLEKLFGPAGGAAKVAATAGNNIGHALTSGLTIGTLAGPPPPALAKAIQPVSPSAPLALTPPSTLALSNQIAQTPQTIALDLTVVLDDGRKVHAVTTIPAAPKTSLTQRVKAEVHAS